MAKRENKKSKTARKTSFKALVMKLTLLAALLFAVCSVGYQIFRKPGEILNLVISEQPKAPKQTWEAYSSSFKSHSTNLIEPEFLAALAQVESSGRAMASPPWVFSWEKLTSERFYSAFAPMTSAFGLMQITDGFYQRAKNYCVKNQKVVRRGSWKDFKSCWFNMFYFRGVPSHAIEMTSAFLHTEVLKLKRSHRQKMNKLKRIQVTGAIHLCGLNRVRRWMARYQQIPQGARCGRHSVKAYTNKLRRYYGYFKNLNRELPKAQLIAAD